MGLWHDLVSFVEIFFGESDAKQACLSSSQLLIHTVVTIIHVFKLLQTTSGTEFAPKKV